MSINYNIIEEGGGRGWSAHQDQFEQTPAPATKLEVIRKW